MSILHTIRGKGLGAAANRGVRRALHGRLAGSEAARPISRVHASDLTREGSVFCPRVYALMDLTDKTPRSVFLSTAQRVTFHIGRVLQEATVGWLADAGMAWGDWACRACGEVRKFRMRPPLCRSCGGRTFAPIEVRFRSTVSGISCGIDALIRIDDDPKLTVLEIKTIDKEEFRELVAPLAEHRIRTALYLRIIEESKSRRAQQIQTDSAVVLYISKGGWGCKDESVSRWGFRDAPYSPFKEFVVTRDDPGTEVFTQRAKLVKDFRDGGPMPEGVCASSLTEKARFCPVAVECFSGKYPAGGGR